MNSFIKKVRIVSLAFLAVFLVAFPSYASAYQIAFDGNGGEGTMQVLTVDTGKEVVLPENQFSKGKNVFVNWNTKQDGSGISYAGGGTFKYTSETIKNVILYAQWADPADTYLVFYEGNGADSGQFQVKEMAYQPGGKLETSWFAKKGYYFLGWNTKADGSGTSYQAGESLSQALVGAESYYVVLYAQWAKEMNEERTVTVTATWEDEDDMDGIRPSKWHAILTGSNGKTYSGDSDGNTLEFFHIPTVDSKGAVIQYSLSVTEPNGYDVLISQDTLMDDNKAHIKFLHEPTTTTVKIYGTFDDDNDEEDIRPDKITLKLRSSEGKIYKKTLDIDGDDEYDYRFVGLPAYEDGDKITYKLTVSGASKYQTDIEKNGNTFEITHIHKSPLYDITVETVWDDNSNKNGKRPDQFQVVLTGGGRTRSAVLTRSNGYSTEFQDMPEYKNGKKISYNLTTADPQDYKATISGDASSGFTITQKYIINTVSETKQSVENTTKETEPAKKAPGTAENISNSEEETKTAISTQSSDAAFAFLKLVWADIDSGKRTDVKGTLNGSDGSKIEISIPKGNDKEWIKQVVKPGISYTLTVQEIKGYKTAISSFNKKAVYFTVKNTLITDNSNSGQKQSKDGYSGLAKEPGTDGKNTAELNDSSKNQTSTRQSKGGIVLSGSIEDGQNEEETAYEEKKGHVYNEDGTEIIVKEGKVADERLLGKDKGNSMTVIIGLTLAAFVVLVAVLLWGKIKKSTD